MSNGTTNGNGQVPPWLRYTCYIVEKVGFPVALIVVIVYLLGFKFGPPIVEGHLTNLEVQTETLKTVTESMDSIDDAVQNIEKIEEESAEFMKAVKSCHDQQLQDHADIMDRIDDVHDELQSQ